MLVGDSCSRRPITIRSHDLHVGDIKRAMGGIAREIRSLLLFGPFELCIFWPFFGLPLFVSLGMVLVIVLLYGFFVILIGLPNKSNFFSFFCNEPI